MKKNGRWEKIFRIMKCTIFLMLFFVFGVQSADEGSLVGQRFRSVGKNNRHEVSL